MYVCINTGCFSFSLLLTENGHTKSTKSLVESHQLLSGRLSTRWKSHTWWLTLSGVSGGQSKASAITYSVGGVGCKAWGQHAACQFTEIFSDSTMWKMCLSSILTATIKSTLCVAPQVKLLLSFILFDERKLFIFLDRPGCGMVDIWDLEDKENIDRPSCCHALEKDARPFKRVFSNQKYKVYKLR